MTYNDAQIIVGNVKRQILGTKKMVQDVCCTAEDVVSMQVPGGKEGDYDVYVQVSGGKENVEYEAFLALKGC